MKVDQIPYNPGPAAWTCILASDKGHPELSQNRSCEWLVIGAGFAGLSAARRLQVKRPKDRIIVLEAQALAEGPSGRNSGFMIDLPHDLSSKDYGSDLNLDRITISQNRYAIDFARKTVSELALPRESFQEIGKINAAATGTGFSHNMDYSSHLSKLGEVWEHYDSKTMEEITGSKYYIGGLFTPGTVMLQPALYVRSLGKKLLSKRLEIFEKSPVISLKRSGSDWCTITPKGTIFSPKVILATNGHLESFGYFKRRLVHLFTYGSMTKPLHREEKLLLGGRDNWGLTSADPLGSTVRRIRFNSEDRIVIRNSVTYEPKMRPENNKLNSIYEAHLKSFRSRFPQLSRTQMEYKWGGHLTLSLNKVPAFAEVESGLFTACCQNGLGTVKGTLHGIAASDYALGEKNEIVSQLLKADYPQKLPPEPIAGIFAKILINLGKFRAGKEF